MQKTNNFLFANSIAKVTKKTKREDKKDDKKKKKQDLDESVENYESKPSSRAYEDELRKQFEAPLKGTNRDEFNVSEDIALKEGLPMPKDSEMVIGDAGEGERADTVEDEDIDIFRFGNVDKDDSKRIDVI